MTYVADLTNYIDSDSEFSLKNIPKEFKDVIKKYQNMRKWCSPKKFKFKNDTGIFEVNVYLSDHYRVVMDVLLVSKKFIIIDTHGIYIQDNGEVFYFLEDYSRKRKIKTNTGFVLSLDEKEMILDFLGEMEVFSNHLREKYYRNK